MNHRRMNGIANGGTSIQDETESHSDSEEEWSGGGPVTLMVFDLRSYTAALGNRAKGGGYECTGECIGSFVIDHSTFVNQVQ